MKSRNQVTCPNCFGVEHREGLATATSRDTLKDDEPTNSAKKKRSQPDREGTLIKMFCSRCGHELTTRGNRA
ncbi:hypothetical protein SAMN05660860_01458 [Geoalkalibacter ferrihydriticus]|uniref:Uncharacterized protein n=2 Tax=Geoalkalibacter ferrihydriticus TaxID=392333 RepID=A0A0C2HHD5_9BACT|nr:hypothetical protein [Geoalkalibacter ferrihydriticus]KIH76406.1 hypothetical protein GFER_09225 [Geoalkalibacter ferrihydriticus DSM 17813]SDL92894.1 hypothetical protein SAMN05660860_01458 [Geoalkalibacter ferrihydriticus]